MYPENVKFRRFYVKFRNRYPLQALPVAVFRRFFYVKIAPENVKIIRVKHLKCEDRFFEIAVSLACGGFQPVYSWQV
jgi:hypothetical protein